MKIGEIIPADREIVLNEGKKTTKIMVANKGDRPVQVGSQFSLFRSKQIAFLLTVRLHMVIIWIFHPVLLSALSREKKKSAAD
mgnify:CR=1 FL=1